MNVKLNGNLCVGHLNGFLIFNTSIDYSCVFNAKFTFLYGAADELYV